MANPADYLTRHFYQGVEGWRDYAPFTDAARNHRYVHGIMSRVHAVAGESCHLVVGTTKGTGTWPVEIYAFTPDLVIEIIGDPGFEEGTALVDVHPRSDITDIRVHTAELVTSNDIFESGSGSLTFSVSYPFGTAKIAVHNLSDGQHRELLATFLKDLTAQKTR